MTKKKESFFPMLMKSQKQHFTFLAYSELQDEKN